MNRKSLGAIAVAVVAAALLVFAFVQGRSEFAKEREREAPVKAPSRVSTVAGEAVVAIDDATLAKSGITVAALAPAQRAPEHPAYATVLAVQDLADGRASYANARAQLDKAHTTLDAARNEYQRLKQLHDDDRNISDKAFQAGAAALATEEANVRAAQVAVQSVDASVEQHYGSVVAKWFANDAPALQRVVRQQDVLVQIALPGESVQSRPPGTIRLQAGDNVFVSASLLGRAPRVDPRVQGMAYLYLAPAQALTPGMNVLAYLPGEGAVGGVLIPHSAAVWWQGKPWVYVQRSPGHFARIEVPADQPTPEGFIVRSGLRAADHVVVTGAQLLLSEEFRSQIQVGEEGGGK